MPLPKTESDKIEREATGPTEKTHLSHAQGMMLAGVDPRRSSRSRAPGSRLAALAGDETPT